ncbi:MAG: CDP-paratose 2-epimerase [Gaiellaceae bacterium]|nr:CDP-paratose 2-epimerase [Gaiellaceae bacterium]
MPIAVVTGAGGLVGADTSAALCERGFDVLGIDNDLRATFFGSAASTKPQLAALASAYETFRHVDLDIRDADGVAGLFAEHGARIELVLHAAAQPSHDWAALEPLTDFTVNANGTLNMLEAARQHAPDATFVFTSTNKVYGDAANELPLVELETRLELPEGHRWHGGIDTTMSIDRTTHSLFGVSKAAADLLVQEYGRYFGMPTVCFRGGCLTGPRHAGARLHGFLSYLMRCTVSGEPYTVYGYGGKQVRDNLHSSDLVRAFLAFHDAPRPASVYNIGGGRTSNCSMLEAIALCEEVAGRTLEWTLSDDARIGDHRWWISDLGEFAADYPDWRPTYGVAEILREIHDENRDAWTEERVSARR